MRKINGKLKTELNSLLQQNIQATKYIIPSLKDKTNIFVTLKDKRKIFITPTTEIPQSKF